MQSVRQVDSNGRSIRGQMKECQWMLMTRVQAIYTKVALCCLSDVPVVTSLDRGLLCVILEWPLIGFQGLPHVHHSVLLCVGNRRDWAAVSPAAKGLA